MMNRTVAIVDYGLGNLYSIRRAIEYLGGTVIITADPEMIAEAGRMILPGVGAFGEGIANLEKKNLTGPVKEFAMTGRPLLGICLGMQLLMDGSEELGAHKGLGIIGGKVVRIPVQDAAAAYKIPHVGWNAVSAPNKTVTWDDTVLKGVPGRTFMYFVHSYVPVPTEDRDILAVTRYGERDFCSVVQRGAICGCQFHPEKSGEAGLSILNNFLRS